MDYQEALPIIRRLAVEQGRLALDRWASVAPLAMKNRRDFVTDVDLEIEENIKTELRRHFPGHGLSGEETEDENRRSEFQWLIDPIDGTKYYAGQASLFAVSIGLLHHGEPVLGVIYNAAAGQCFYASQGAGAFLDEVRLRGPSRTGEDPDDLARVIASVDAAKTDEMPDDERDWFERKLVALTRRVYRIRALGLGSLSACWLATGALDAYVDLTGYVKPQDIAAGRIVMSEAGARVGEIDPGVGKPRLLAAPPDLFLQLENILME